MIIEKISNCARCNGDHDNIEMTPLTDNPHYTHFALCPGNGQPILIRSHSDLELPVEEQMTKTFKFPYIGWESIEQLEDVIGEEESCNLHFNNIDKRTINYDLEITIRRTRRSYKERYYV